MIGDLNQGVIMKESTKNKAKGLFNIILVIIVPIIVYNLVAIFNKPNGIILLIFLYWTLLGIIYSQHNDNKFIDSEKDQLKKNYDNYRELQEFKFITSGFEKTIFKYNKDGLLIEQIELSPFSNTEHWDEMKVKFHYDKDRLIRSDYYHGSEFTKSIFLEYDNNNNLINEIQKDENGEYFCMDNYKYDDNNYLIQETHYNSENKSREKIYYKNDTNGRPIQIRVHKCFRILKKSISDDEGLLGFVHEDDFIENQLIPELDRVAFNSYNESGKIIKQTLIDDYKKGDELKRYTKKIIYGYTPNKNGYSSKIETYDSKHNLTEISFGDYDEKDNAIIEITEKNKNFRSLHINSYIHLCN